MTLFSVGRIQELAGQLIVAQEAERERIARELHDDVGQQLAGLSLALSGLRRRIAHHDQAVLEASLTTLQQQTMGLADTVGRLAHELHPGELRQIGLVEALKIRCDEFQHTRRRGDVRRRGRPHANRARRGVVSVSGCAGSAA